MPLGKDRRKDIDKATMLGLFGGGEKLAKWRLSVAIILGGAALGAHAYDFRGGGVLPDGSSEHRLTFSSHSWEQDERDEDLLIANPAFRYGISTGHDIEIGLPVRQVDDKRDLHGVEFAFGFPLAADADNDSHVTLTAHGRLLPTDEPWLGSGSEGAGLAVHIGHRLGNSAARVDGFLGLERADVAYRDREGYEAINRLRYATRLEQGLGQSLALSAELETHIGLSGEEVQNQFALYVRPGLRWSPTPHSDWRLVYGQEVVEREAAPSDTIQLTFVYTPEPRESRQSLTARIEQLEAEKRRLAQNDEQLFARTASLRRDSESQDERLTELGDELSAEAESLRTNLSFLGSRTADNRDAIERLERRSGALHIEVVNRSGERAPASQLIEELERQGHRVVRRIERVDEPPREATELHYREGFVTAATSLGETLPGSPEVSAADPEIPRGANVRVIVGADFPVEEPAPEEGDPEEGDAEDADTEDTAAEDDEE
ncbi:LytR C-terminal domain-containing protein [Halorhodospira halochloris]|uniref:LytR C-terminal domain-containing protein n=1 Tax=Halorhodospira halochloris TaxID=1052 RepID=UPI001EE7B7B8|nr:LytR C-terminal domain-containing protein [Halorhodospira halochloris]MCG5548176.1 LytR C-terminal domain-containing protein [Halorhodospira halochloris]